MSLRKKNSPLYFIYIMLPTTQKALSQSGALPCLWVVICRHRSCNWTSINMAPFPLYGVCPTSSLYTEKERDVRWHRTAATNKESTSLQIMRQVCRMKQTFVFFKQHLSLIFQQSAFCTAHQRDHRHSAQLTSSYASNWWTHVLSWRRWQISRNVVEWKKYKYSLLSALQLHHRKLRH